MIATSFSDLRDTTKDMFMFPESLVISRELVMSIGSDAERLLKPMAHQFCGRYQ